MGELTLAKNVFEPGKCLAANIFTYGYIIVYIILHSLYHIVDGIRHFLIFYLISVRVFFYNLLTLFFICLIYQFKASIGLLLVLGKFYCNFFCGCVTFCFVYLYTFFWPLLLNLIIILGHLDRCEVSKWNITKIININMILVLSNKDM